MTGGRAALFAADAVAPRAVFGNPECDSWCCKCLRGSGKNKASEAIAIKGEEKPFQNIHSLIVLCHFDSQQLLKLPEIKVICISVFIVLPGS